MAINVAKDMYEKGQKQLEDFSTKYGDFMTPILKDQDWYDKNVTGAARDLINNIYANGGDPLRDAASRAAISRFIYSLPVGDISKVKQSAIAANEYLKNRAKLEAEGLYNPDTDKYDGPQLSDFSTIEGGQIWDKMSPTPYQNMAVFSKDYFDNIQPFQRAASKNGISYSVSEINMDDLHRIADAHFNDLIGTPQGRLMYKMYKDQFGSEEAARNAFNNAVVSGNTDRLRYADNYEDMRDKAIQRNLQQQQINISRENLEINREKLRLQRQQKEEEAVNKWTIRQRDAVALKEMSKPKDIVTKNLRQHAIQQLKATGIQNPDKNQITEYMIRMLERNYKYHTVVPQGYDRLTAFSLAAGFSSPQQLNSIQNEKGYKVQFSPGSGLNLTYDRFAAYGNRILKNHQTNEIYDYLVKNHISGYINDENISVSTQIGRDNGFDINFTMRIPISYMNNFYKSKSFNSREDYLKYLGKAGATFTDKDGKVLKNEGKKNTTSKDLVYKNIEYIDLPVTRTVESNFIIDNQIDTHNASLISKRFAQDVNNDLQQDYE